MSIATCLWSSVQMVRAGYSQMDRERIRHRRMLEAEGLAGMGKAVASVAHDMKTPLIAIGGFTSLVQKKLKKDDPNYGKLNIVIGETRRLEKMAMLLIYLECRKFKVNRQ